MLKIVGVMPTPIKALHSYALVNSADPLRLRLYYEFTDHNVPARFSVNCSIHVIQNIIRRQGDFWDAEYMSSNVLESVLMKTKNAD